jgi:hypothetical protein
MKIVFRNSDCAKINEYTDNIIRPDKVDAIKDVLVPENELGAIPERYVCVWIRQIAIGPIIIPDLP